MAIKIHLEKAYDRLNQSFINDVLKELKFPDSVQCIIVDCIATSLNVLWNGSKTGEFFP